MGRKRAEKKTQSEEQRSSEKKREMEDGWEALGKLRHTWKWTEEKKIWKTSHNSNYCLLPSWKLSKVLHALCYPGLTFKLLFQMKHERSWKWEDTFKNGVLKSPILSKTHLSVHELPLWTSCSMWFSEHTAFCRIRQLAALALERKAWWCYPPFLATTALIYQHGAANTSPHLQK